METTEKPTVAIVGAGRLGSALAHRLAHLGYTITGIYSRTFRAAKRLAVEIGTQATETYPSADILFLTVPDDEIEKVAQDIAKTAPSLLGAVVHTSGVHSLDSLVALTSREKGSFHPLYPFRDGTYLTGRESMLVAIEASSPQLEHTLTNIALDIGGRPALVQKKTQYHLAATMASNYLVTLFDLTLDLMVDAGIPTDLARDALVRLMQGNLDNLAHIDPSDALTGPIARGDVETVQRHLDSLGSRVNDYTKVYILLGTLTIQLAPHLDSETREKLYKVLHEIPIDG